MTDRVLGNPHLLSQEAREILTDAAMSLVNEWFRDACDAQAGGLDPESPMGWALPPKHRHGRDARFARRLLRSLVVVVERLGDPTRGAPFLHCTAEEIALKALVEAVEAHADGLEIEVDFEILREFVAEDVDVDLLWDMSLDGIEDPDLDLGTSPTVNLQPDRWFEPFGHVQEGWTDPYEEA